MVGRHHRALRRQHRRPRNRIEWLHARRGLRDLAFQSGRAGPGRHGGLLAAGGVRQATRGPAGIVSGPGGRKWRGHLAACGRGLEDRRGRCTATGSRRCATGVRGLWTAFAEAGLRRFCGCGCTRQGRGRAERRPGRCFGSDQVECAVRAHFVARQDGSGGDHCSDDPASGRNPLVTAATARDSTGDVSRGCQLTRNAGRILQRGRRSRQI